LIAISERPPRHGVRRRAGGEATLAEMAAACGRPSIADLALTASDLEPDRRGELIDRFVNKARASPQPSPQADLRVMEGGLR
jgi:hypothetical protein